MAPNIHKYIYHNFVLYQNPVFIPETHFTGIGGSVPALEPITWQDFFLDVAIMWVLKPKHKVILTHPN